MKIDHALFVQTLKARGITQKYFSKYAKIPYNTVTGWKKRGKVPAYAMVIAKDIVYRKELNIQAKMQMKRKLKKSLITLSYLTAREQKRIESAFWGTNYTVQEIIRNVEQGDETFLKQFRNNVPHNLQKKVMDNIGA